MGAARATRAAHEMLDAARPVAARLAAGRHPDDIAADLIELWGAVEGALRALVGGSALGGVPLVSELRGRGLLTLDQANALASFAGARERVQATEYHPTAADAEAGRHAFTLLHAGFESAARAPSTVAAAGAPLPPHGAPVPGDATHGPSGVAAAGGEALSTTHGRARTRRRAALGLVVLVVAAAVALGGWWLVAGREPPALRRGMALYAAGQLDAAAAEFERAAAARPRLALPRIYLGRIARERGDPAAAGRELARAVALEPDNALAQRELGSFFLAQGQYDAARRRYVRAVQLAPADLAAQGYLGCALARLGRPDLAATWVQRAGSGPWQTCAGGPRAQP